PPSHITEPCDVVAIALLPRPLCLPTYAAYLKILRTRNYAVTLPYSGTVFPCSVPDSGASAQGSPPPQGHSATPLPRYPSQPACRRSGSGWSSGPTQSA